ncbi:MAG: hypothetical protein LBG97_08615 [Coriobacteriales bacterium]|nr:hypothetical protein [Coriobacteriales bacterium]
MCSAKQKRCVRHDGSIFTVSLFVAIVAAFSLVFALLPQAAFAYFDRGPVGISLGASSVSVAAGSSVNVSVALSPAQDDQTIGCGMAECPQTCGEKGCLDANGQCVCAGGAYSTYYTQVQAASSNGAVATATYSGGALTINGVGAGSATITLTASLRQHSSTSAIVNVTVTASAGTDTGSGAGGSNATGGGATGGGAAGGGATGGSNANTSNGGTNSNNASNSTNTNTSNNSGATNTNNGQSGASQQQSQTGAAIAQTASEGDGTSRSEQTVQSMMGTDIHLVRYSDTTDVVAVLRQIAGTKEEATFWMGGTVDRPNYSWTFKGESLDSKSLDVYGSINLNIDISESGTAAIAEMLKNGKADTKKTVVLGFAHSGALPAAAIIYIAAPSTMSQADALSLYYYDSASKTFAKRLDGLKVESGYIAFSVDHCSIWAISASNLSALGSKTQADTAADAQVDFFFGLGIAPFVIVGVLVLVVILMLVLVFMSRRTTVAAASPTGVASVTSGAIDSVTDIVANPADVATVAAESSAASAATVAAESSAATEISEAKAAANTPTNSSAAEHD